MRLVQWSISHLSREGSESCRTFGNDTDTANGLFEYMLSITRHDNNLDRKVNKMAVILCWLNRS